jgi:hypothetical protein
VETLFDRARIRLDISAIRTLFGLKTWLHRTSRRPLAQEIVIEKPQYGLSWFRTSFGRLQLKAYTKAEQSCASRPPCTTPKSCAAAAAWTTSTRSSTG